MDHGAFPSCEISQGDARDVMVTKCPTAAAFYVRWGLMAADHFVSGLDPARPAVRSTLAARVLEHLNNPEYADYHAVANKKQKLRGHLDAVSFASGWAVRYLLKNRLRRVLPEIDGGFAAEQAGREGRYAWQGASVDRIMASPYDASCLCLVTSSTGSGKTKACIAMADALCQRKGLGLRATVALGLRSLTLQTGDAYRETLGFGRDQLSVLIGSRAASKLHTAARDEDESGDEWYQTDGGDFWRQQKNRLPPLISGEFSSDNDDAGYLLVPVLVSTIDQIIKAADLRRAGWMKPMLRLASGPLIIDEIDNYDLADMVPVLRLIYFAGLTGQDVLCSSATLYPAVTNAIIRAHQAGCSQRHGLLEKTGVAHQVGFFSDMPDGSGWVDVDANPVLAYKDFCASQQRASDNEKRRLMAFLPDYQDEDAAWADLGAQVEWMHERHAWDAAEGGRISVGMVRFAHVRDVVKAVTVLGAHLSKSVQIVLVPYHSRNFMLSRAFIEYRLDGLLQRGQLPNAPEHDKDVRRRLAQARAAGKSLCVVVVCSPVEEVGRDHDFDWGIVEPSSTRAVVQAAGRVLRHRHALVPGGPNVRLYRKPMRAFRPHFQKYPVYARPGFETADAKYDNRHRFHAHHHDMRSLMGMNDGETAVIRPSWCYQPEHPLPIIENRAIDEYLNATFTEEWLNDPVAAMCSSHFDKHRFRVSETNGETCFLDVRHGLQKIVREEDRSEWLGAKLVSILPAESLLFSEEWPDIELFWAERLGVTDITALCKRYMKIELRKTDGNVDIVYGVVPS